MTSAVLDDAHVAVQAVFTSPTYSDLTVLCGNDKYLLHRAIVCPRSEFFNAACDGGSEEASTATINLDNDDPQSVNRMLIYLYTNKYPEGEIPSIQRPARLLPSKPPLLQNPSSRTSANLANSKRGMTVSSTEPALSRSLMLNNVQIYVIAEKYDLPGLKTPALEKFQQSANRPSAFLDTPDLPIVIGVIYKSTADVRCAICSIIIDFCLKNIDEITKHPAMTETIQNTGLLSYDIMIKLRENNEATRSQPSDSDNLNLKAEKSRMVQQIAKLEAMNKELATAKQVSDDQLKKAISGEQMAIRQKEFAINQRNGVIVERDTALNKHAIYLARLDDLLSNAAELYNCNNCRIDFNAYLDRFGEEEQSISLRLRCGGCGCRHDIGAGCGPGRKR